VTSTPTRSRRAKVPFVAQMEAVECGAACLTMALHAHGCFTPLAEVRAACGVARDGVSALGLVKAARGLGLQPRARKLEPAQLAEVACPAILHWQMNHFVLLTGARGGLAEIHDPAISAR
jgi:ABC-type bacteriocin/lantibiotic exporter with double-glycine peptidase domain